MHRVRQDASLHARRTLHLSGLTFRTLALQSMAWHTTVNSQLLRGCRRLVRHVLVRSYRLEHYVWASRNDGMERGVTPRARFASTLAPFSWHQDQVTKLSYQDSIGMAIP